MGKSITERALKRQKAAPPEPQYKYRSQKLGASFGWSGKSKVINTIEPHKKGAKNA